MIAVTFLQTTDKNIFKSTSFLLVINNDSAFITATQSLRRTACPTTVRRRIKKNELQSGEERKTSDCSSLLVQLFSYAVIRSITRRWYFQRSALRDARTDSSCAITIGFSRRSVRRVVFGLPTVHECGLDGIPVAGALRVLEEGGTELVLPLFGRHHGEVPRDCDLVRILIFNSGADTLVPDVQFPAERPERSL